ncbi:DUF3261 domain-containing protein [Thalassospira sp. UBA4513]|uniref:DUF3261 domain-containing protein n=1 Tax=Thalassospira sp. UBA4513 TaxID=1947675 RepID=UPI002580AAFA|nr:DUF3261 domain-containing protein [Thalassospira sp. UBA4513]
MNLPQVTLPDVFSGNAGHKVALADGLEFTLPAAPWDEDETIDVTQQVEATWNNQAQSGTATFQGRINIQPDRARIVLIDDLGRRAVEIDWTAEEIIIQNANWLPQEFDTKRLLADIVMTYWPLDAVEDALPDNMSVHEGFGERTIRLDDTGRKYATIEHPIKDVWQGQAILKNQQFNYRIKINSIRTGN